MNFCYLSPPSPPVWDTLLQQPELTNTDHKNMLARPLHEAVTQATFLRSPSFLCALCSVTPRVVICLSIYFMGTFLLKHSKPADGLLA